jgi:hypothetical protein
MAAWSYRTSSSSLRGLAVMALRVPIAALALLVLRKMGIDVIAHVRQHTGAGGQVLRTARIPDQTASGRTPTDR